MLDLLKRLVSSEGFMPHGHCYLWQPGLVWLHSVSDGLIALSYLSIPVSLVYIIRKRRDLPFNWMFGCFGLFIVACGSTHVMEVWTLWHPTYWLSGTIKAVTAVASLGTSVLLVKLLPSILAIPSPEALRLANAALAAEVAYRKEAERAVRGLNATLEERVRERTAQWEEANRQLREEIGQRERAEAALRRSHDELEQRVAERTVQLEFANKELEAFSYSVSHDLRAPLRAIDGLGRIVLESHAHQLDAEGRHYFVRMREASGRMKELIDDLLSLSRVAGGTLRAETVDLSEAAAGIIAEFRQAQPPRSAEVVIQPAIQVVADADLMRILLVNLLGNAWKFTSKTAAARIELGVEASPDGPVYFVRDNGAGFDMTYANKLFGAFQRLHSREEFEGTGIGLATVQRIVHRHGGRVWAQSRIGEGATFYFTLPMSRPAAIVPATPEITR